MSRTDFDNQVVNTGTSIPCYRRFCIIPVLVRVYQRAIYTGSRGRDCETLILSAAFLRK